MVIINALGIWNLIATTVCYVMLRRKRALFDDRFATTITKTVTLTVTLILGIHFSVIFPFELSSIFAHTLILGVFIGFLFGSLVKYHSILIGFYHGMVGSSMGVMIGEVLKNPQLCSIPITSSKQILVNMLYLCGFTTFLLTFILSLVLYSLRV
ncbi:hypothetical protein [Ornithinibacillus californiensis]|uniref:hypothetical protein n=1 Tax=Ornithinibacillus californiensis TaxID=161536 RepID=UPI00064E073D|nr:hypothetical protein [Ornithinibacillus californiensis]